jgi:hypothetical protein
MQSKLILAVALSLSAAACSSAPAPETTPSAQPSASAAAVNPVGRFEFTTSMGGQPVTGGLMIAGGPGAYTGEITTSMTPPLPVASVTVNGQDLVVTGDTPDGVVTIRLTFTDATHFTGRWELAGGGGTLSGRRVS